MSWSLSYKNKPISSELYNKTPTDYYCLCKVDMKNIIYNPSSLLNLTITVTGSYMDLFLLSAYILQLFDAVLRQWHFNKALVCVCWILSKITVHQKMGREENLPRQGTAKEGQISNVLSSSVDGGQGSDDNNGP